MPDVRSILVYGLGLALVAALLWGFAERTRGASARQELATVQLAAAKAHAAAEAKERAQEREWSNRTTEIANVAQAKISALEGDLSVARSAAERLRLAARAAASRRASEAPQVAESSPGIAGSDPLDLFVGLLQRHSDELVSVGRYADQLRIAGEACERTADALDQ